MRDTWCPKCEAERAVKVIEVRPSVWKEIECQHCGEHFGSYSESPIREQLLAKACESALEAIASGCEGWMMEDVKRQCEEALGDDPKSV